MKALTKSILFVFCLGICACEDANDPTDGKESKPQKDKDSSVTTLKPLEYNDQISQLQSGLMMQLQLLMQTPDSLLEETLSQSTFECTTMIAQLDEIEPVNDSTAVDFKSAVKNQMLSIDTLMNQEFIKGLLVYESELSELSEAERLNKRAFENRLNSVNMWLDSIAKYQTQFAKENNISFR